MKLSDAIRAGAKWTPPARERFVEVCDVRAFPYFWQRRYEVRTNVLAAAVVGAMPVSVQYMTVDTLRRLGETYAYRLFPELECNTSVEVDGEHIDDTLRNVIVYLDLQRGWSREEIADWIDSLSLNEAQSDVGPHGASDGQQSPGSAAEA